MNMKTELKLKEGEKLEFEHRRYIEHKTSKVKSRGKRESYNKEQYICLLKKNPDYKLSGRGGVTVATLFDCNGDVIASGQAVCSIEDNFCKSLGRTIALGRLSNTLKEGKWK